MIGRRHFLAGAGASLLAGPVLAKEGTYSHPFANGARPLVTMPGKRPLIGLTTRPPQLETPFAVFNEGLLTPNDAFFVRSSQPLLPTSLDTQAFRLAVGGHVERPLQISLAELKSGFPVTEIVAVNQCSGNSRGFFEPRVSGGQWGNGAMGNARWTGVPLRALLDRAGLLAGAREVTFSGLDRPAMTQIPQVIKALDIDHARQDEVLVAYAMNGEDLPFLNGYPLRLVVPGYYGTYWTKHLAEITVLDAAYDGYWMKTAYRIPDNACACVEPGMRPQTTRPIGTMNVRSFLTSHSNGAQVRAGLVELRGIAFDGGNGIAQVLVSPDGGNTWLGTRLGEDIGRFSFREWRLGLELGRGSHSLLVRAVNREGATQPFTPQWQPSGYMRNVVETVRLEVA
ncbi:MAG: molybdopterin-dependent oxidoreductase [Pseudomonadota bacterium]